MFYALIFFISVTLQSTISIYYQGWTTTEFAAADTGKNVAYLNEVEKETLLYLNLARLYPKKYALLEVPKDMLIAGNEKANWNAYRRSLLKDLNSMQPVTALMPDMLMTSNAKCFAKESGEMGKIGHLREQCPKENYAECNAYGIATGRDIVINLLIDHKVPNVGHRRTMLSSIFNYAGLGFYDRHVKYRHCLVLVMQ